MKGDDHLNAKGMLVEPNHEGVYQYKCPKGHIGYSVLQDFNFEILFEIGLYAIIDGYYREAVSSFSASLERFYEFYTHLAATKNKIEHKDFYESWNEVSKQSERQLGAFIFVWLLENKRSPKILTNKQRNFRNGVIHSGVIPAKEEVVTYGQAILDIYFEHIKIIKENYANELQVVIGEQQRIRCSKVPDGFDRTFGVQGLTINVIAKKDEHINLEKELVRVARKRAGFIRST